MTNEEIESILKKYISKISKFPNVNFKNYPEVHDEHSEMLDSIIISAREELKLQFSNKLMKNYKNSHHGDMVIKEYLKTL
jgi:FMN-dependent NADH-azoreductase